MTVITETSLADWDDICAIYVEGINGGNATFSTAPPDSYEEWMDGKKESCCIIMRDSDNLKALGWACLTPTSKRLVFSGVQELSVYVTSSAQGKGIGKELINQIISRAEKENVWTIQSGIFPENIPSLRLHTSCGFREVGKRERIGLMMNGTYAGQWRDIVLTEYRSKVVGVGV